MRDKGFMLTKDTNTPHGAILARSFNVLSIVMRDADFLVRERGFARHARETQAIFKMVGIADLAAWFSGRKVFEEIAPLTVKKLITGSGKASKEEVAAALELYVGKQEYACDDESDAVAVGIAWLIQKGYLDEGRQGSP